MVSSPEAIIVMGVSGCGKSTVGQLLAERAGWVFADADDYHTPENVAKMAAGQPLNDSDRAPWLEKLKVLIDETSAKCGGIILACSALRAKYRRHLASGRVVPTFVFLDGSKELIAARMAARDGHFMPIDLLESQFDLLEVPEKAVRVPIDKPADAIVDEIMVGLWPGKGAP